MILIFQYGEESFFCLCYLLERENFQNQIYAPYYYLFSVIQKLYSFHVGDSTKILRLQVDFLRKVLVIILNFFSSPIMNYPCNLFEIIRYAGKSCRKKSKIFNALAHKKWLSYTIMSKSYHYIILVCKNRLRIMGGINLDLLTSWHNLMTFNWPFF